MTGWGLDVPEYSTTPLSRKLGLKDGHTVHLRDAPDGFLDLLEPLPAVRIGTGLGEPVDVAVTFATTQGQLDAAFQAVTPALSPAGGLWIAWPKRSSKIPSEIGFTEVQETGLAAGLVDNKSCSIDADWQAMRFVRRLRDRITP